MGYCCSEILQLVNRFKITDQRIKLQETKLALDVTQNCSAFNLSFKKMCAGNFVIFFYEIKPLVTSLTLKKAWGYLEVPSDSKGKRRVSWFVLL